MERRLGTGVIGVGRTPRTAAARASTAVAEPAR